MKRIGTKARDTLLGSDEDDRLYGEGGSDLMYGGAGHDRLYGGLGADTLVGGDGNDTLFGEGSSDLLDGGAGADKIIGGDGNDTADGGDGDDTIYAENGDDLISGGAGADKIDAGAGNDTVDGGEGDDTIYGDSGHDSITGGLGSDKIYAASGNDTVDAGTGDDLVEAGAGADSILGGSGSDEIQGEGGDDTIIGGEDDGELIWEPAPGDGEDDDDEGEDDDDEDDGGDGEGGGGGDGGDDCVPVSALSFVIGNTEDGNPDVRVTITEDSGDLEFVLTVIAGSGTGFIADLRGLFFDIDASLEGLLGGLSASGEHINVTQFEANAVNDLGNGANINGDGPKKTDIGVEIGTQGKAENDIQATGFTLSHATQNLTLDMFAGMNFGVRLTSVGIGENREGSLKLFSTSGAVTQVCIDEAGNVTPHGGDAELTSFAASSASLVEAEAAPVAAPRLASMKIGDNLYGNNGRDTFIFGRGDGVDLIWDFEAGKDIVKVDYNFSEVDAFTFVTDVINTGRDSQNPLDAGTHEKLAIILDASGDAIVFNDLGNRTSDAGAVQFNDVTVSVKQLLALATPRETATANPVDAGALDIQLAVTSSWAGGFQGEIRVTATETVSDWEVLLGSRWQVQNVWNASLAGQTKVAGGSVYDVDDAGWNSELAAGQSLTIGFTGVTGQKNMVDAQQILDGLWIA